MIDFSRARVLVTGGAGFIGSALVWELNRRGCERIVIADFLESSEKWRNLSPLAFEDYLEADDLLARLGSASLGRFDVVLHMGACSSTTERNAAYLARNNYQFTKDLAACALSSNARFVYASSAATYGDGAAGMRDDASLAYLHTLRPLNMYGYSKQMFDLYAARRGIIDKIAGLKFFNIFGPNENHKGDMRSLVNKAYDQVMETGEIKLFRSYRPDYADGEQKRDFLYVKDAVAMTLHVAANDSANGLFNVGSGEANSWLDLANAVFAALGKPSNIRFIDMPDELRSKYQYFTQADIKRVRESGYAAPVTTLADGVANYVREYLAPGRRLGDTPNSQ
ncbi:MAG: ADP-glyceromanno-heptose 6-epimerase [Gemmatimonadaceae bacterium]